MSLTYEQYLESPAGQLELKGERRGEIKSLLKLLDLRGIEVSDSAREQIEGCTDEDTVDRWFSRAVNASSVEEIFD
ncbi:hypothetical protein [Glycomyces salinus]|uniref:hypothetical protein n=1 Tax=Glycomyces salinus TaxID=980294 RepID=UPI0018EB6548|nr:hypothetical protein [Glycomyces salinus]